MTSNLKSARKAIEAELAHARKGAAYYAARVEALESALQQLEHVEDGASLAGKGASTQNATPTAARRSRKSAASNGHASAGRRGVKRAAASGDLPTTGGEFWLELVGPQPQSAVDISNAAASKLGIGADQKAKIQKLKQRVAPALASLVSAHKIQDSGSGRERRFFRSGGAQA
jgi:hypothetical protein